MKKTTKILLIITIILFIFIMLIIPMTATIIAYNANFNIRAETSCLPSSLKFEDYSMKRTKIEFSSNRGQIIRGYIYEQENWMYEPKALIVFSHGYLGTHIDYLNQINFFVENGYMVLGFDNTGSGESDGENMIGLAQSPIDLDYALKYVENTSILNQYKILLYGHSWGGYAVCAVLNYNHNVTGVVSRSGFSNSRDMLVEYGSNLYGDWLSILSPYAYVYEKIKFGNSVDLNGIKGINHSNCNILLLHSTDDPVISLKNSLLVHKNDYVNSDRIKTILLDHKGHDVVMSDNAIEYEKKQNILLEELYTEYNAEVPKDKLDIYYRSKKKKLLYELDSNIMNQILNFYEACLKED